MATMIHTPDSTAYIQVTTSPTDTDAVIQNTGSVDIYLVFQATIPDVDADNFHILRNDDGQALQVISGTPSDSAWIRAATPNRIGRVAVSK